MRHRLLPLILVALLSLTLTSCNNDDSFLDTVAVTVPVIKTKSEIRNSISIKSAQPTNSDGKIYVLGNLLFYIAQNSGVHIFDNQNPLNPQNMSFIEIPGVNDISIKNNILYADNYMDLLVFDISNISDIQLVNVEEDLLTHYALFPNDVSYYQTNVYPENDDEFIAYYESMDMLRSQVEDNPNIENWDVEIWLNTTDAAESGNEVGVGGSYAKFQIFNDALYTLDDYKLSTYNIINHTSISLVSENWLGGWFGGELETTFIKKDYMFIGATNGMHIVGLQDEFSPQYISSFLHATGCDPVVVEENTAYITVRGGNSCGAIEDQVNIIDISDIAAPVEFSTYFLDSPYGLGIKDQVLYVCNDNGINVFNAQNPSNLELVNTYNVDSKDVIPLSTHLISVGENVIHQFNYTDGFGLESISTIQF